MRVPIPPEHYNVGTILDANVAAGRGDKAALSCGDERLTYQDLLDGASRAGNALAALGVGREQRVLMVMGDTPPFVTVFFGALRLGAVPVLVNSAIAPPTGSSGIPPCEVYRRDQPSVEVVGRFVGRLPTQATVRRLGERGDLSIRAFQTPGQATGQAGDQFPSHARRQLGEIRLAQPPATRFLVGDRCRRPGGAGQECDFAHRRAWRYGSDANAASFRFGGIDADTSFANKVGGCRLIPLARQLLPRLERNVLEDADE